MADRVLMLENAYYSVITPEACLVILFKNVSAAPQMARALNLTAVDLKRLGVIEEILPEPEQGAHTDTRAMAATVKKTLVRTLAELLADEPHELLEKRNRRYRNSGVLFEEKVS